MTVAALSSSSSSNDELSRVKYSRSAASSATVDPRPIAGQGRHGGDQDGVPAAAGDAVVHETRQPCLEFVAETGADPMFRSRAMSSSRPPSCSHGGSTWVSIVLPAVYGYTSNVTRSPAARAASNVRSSACPIRPKLRFPTDFRCGLDACPEGRPGTDRLVDGDAELVALVADMQGVQSVPGNERLADGDDLGLVGVCPRRIDEARAHSPRARIEGLVEVLAHPARISPAVAGLEAIPMAAIRSAPKPTSGMTL